MNCTMEPLISPPDRLSGFLARNDRVPPFQRHRLFFYGPAAGLPSGVGGSAATTARDSTNSPAAIIVFIVAPPGGHGIDPGGRARESKDGLQRLCRKRPCRPLCFCTAGGARGELAHVSRLTRLRRRWSISTRATIASPIGTNRGSRHGSCRPFTRISVGSPVARDGALRLAGCELVGLIATRHTIGMPARDAAEHPAVAVGLGGDGGVGAASTRLVAVGDVERRRLGGAGGRTNTSLFSLPRMLATREPGPVLERRAPPAATAAPCPDRPSACRRPARPARRDARPRPARTRRRSSRGPCAPRRSARSSRPRPSGTGQRTGVASTCSSVTAVGSGIVGLHVADLRHVPEDANALAGEEFLRHRAGRDAADRLAGADCGRRRGSRGSRTWRRR